MGGEEIASRLREVRKSLGLSQTKFGSLGGVGKRAQIYYEKAENEPGASYWQNLHSSGIDFAYILCGAAGARNETESELLLRFRASSTDVQGAVLRALGLPAAGKKPATVAITGGAHGQVVAGDVSQHEVTFNVGTKKKRAAK